PLAAGAPAGPTRGAAGRWVGDPTPPRRPAPRRGGGAPPGPKAEVYAQACGLRLGPVIHIEDVDPESVGGHSHGRRTGGDPEDDGALTPGSVRVEAAVLLGFSLLPE
ncbi:hypothetical protein ACWGCK_34425, partial [Streptomyces virginiae]